jgi:hypothetical protein
MGMLWKGVRFAVGPLAAAIELAAQAPNASERPAFEAASLKVNKSGINSRESPLLAEADSPRRIALYDL